MLRWSWIAVVCLSACRATIPEGRFACDDATECPEGWACVRGHCESSGADGGADAGSFDAGADAAMPDAGADGGVDAGMQDAGPTVRLRVVNAVGSTLAGDALASIQVNIDGDERPIAFGCVEIFDSVASGEIAITFTADAGAVPWTVVLGDDLLIVVARDESAAVTFYAVRDIAPTAPAGRHALTYLNVLRQSATSQPYIITEVRDVSGSTAALPFGSWSAPDDYPLSVPASVDLGYSTGPFGLSVELLAGFTPGLLTENGFVVITGNADSHPSAADGPRAILIPESADACGSLILPDPQVAIANLSLEPRSMITGAPIIEGCLVDTTLPAVSVQAGGLSNGFAVQGGLTRLGLATMDACNTATARIIDLGGLLLSGGRYLLAVTGMLSGPASGWTVSLIEEEIPTSRSEMGATFAHLAVMSAPFSVDIRGGGTSFSTNLAAATWSRGLVDPLVFPSGPWAVTRSGGTQVGTYMTTLDYRAPAGGAFFVLFDRNVAGNPALHAAFVKSAYGASWTLEIDAP